MDYREDPSTHYQHAQYRRHPRTPSILKMIIIINVAVFVLQTIFGIFSPHAAMWFSQIFGLSVPYGIMRGFIWQFLTYAFLHAGPMHLLMNMFFLWMVGRELEPALGRRRFIVFYLTAAVFSGLLFLLFETVQHQVVKGHEYIPCIGASGAVMAAVMAYALYWPNRTVLFMFIIPMRMRTFVIFIAVIEIFGLLDMGRSHIAHMAHLGGLLWGLLFVRYAWAAQGFFERFRAKTRPDSAHNSEYDSGYQYKPDDDRRLNEILDKINSQGIQSLSWSEKRFLKKMSGKR